MRLTIRSQILTVLLCCGGLSFASMVMAKDVTSTKPDQLPNPLSLEQALKLADVTHPDLMLAKAEVEEARAQLELAESESGFNSYLDLAARSTKLSTTGEEVDDSYAKWNLNKVIYDFGRSSSLEQSRTAYLDSRESQLFETGLQHQYEIMKCFFDVLLADHRYNVDNEEMTQRFLKYDKKKERHSLGKISDVELAKAENYYREAMDIRVISDKNRRAARVNLAMAMGRPGQLANDLVYPKLEEIDRAPPDNDALYNQALSANHTIKAIKQEVEAARARVQAERARHYPVIAAEVEAADYHYETSSRGDYSAALTLRVPIYEGGKTSAKVARATADLYKMTSQLKKAEYTLMQVTTDLIKQLEILKTVRASAKQRLSYRDLDLEYKRALYEMERLPTISDAQARISEAQWLAKKADIDTVLLWAKIKMLLGKSPVDSLPPVSPESTEE